MRDNQEGLVSILLAVYRPNRDWLVQQLRSLEQQTYEKIEILIRDDCPEQPVGRDFFAQQLSARPFTYTINPKNLGHAKTFAALAEQAAGDYLAFCDQDDIWAPEKIFMLVEALVKEDATGAYCGLDVMDENGDPVAGDVREIRKTDRFLSGDGLGKQLFVRNCIYGNTILLSSRVAQKGLPLPEGFTHDHWFSLWAAVEGRLIFVPCPLVHYRIHGKNLSTPFRGINTREDYLTQRIEVLEQRCQVQSRVAFDEELSAEIERVRHWVTLRRNWLEKPSITHFWAYLQTCAIHPKIFCFELLLGLTPQKLQKKLFSLLRKRI